MTEAIQSKSDDFVPPADTIGEPPRRRGRLSNFLLWLLVLIAISISSFIVWDRYFFQKGDTTATKVEIEQVRKDQNLSLDVLKRELHSRSDEVEAQVREMDQSLARLKAQLVASVQNLRQDGSEDTRAWRIAEIEYLLRVANYQLTLLRDHNSAISTLDTADSILRELDDFTLAHVREQIAREKQSLKNLQTIDVQGLYFELEALKHNIRNLRFKLPEFISEDTDSNEPMPSRSASEEETISWWSAALDELASLVKVRRHENEVVRPLLSSLDALAIRERLILALERAQFALLHHDDKIYRQTLSDMTSILATHGDIAEHLTMETLTRLEELASSSIEFNVPNISGSLEAIRSVLVERSSDGTSLGPESPPPK